ncbi:hypothetical protein [Winogradskyella jejuensis]|uniref:Outer membrane protein beta-barrel domain-containing protein n=1 Tax=Winogradskyella jejuensis TaxID=1089305 RepID=A0A1M5P7G5_9FLAO|nr:hypothetical protein [Winogradskyella jejuensis]SHG97726.1 hypothetical protein SAMN05444148_1402 [Winogradskyella jejuensis]
MKKILIICLVFACISLGYAQNTYTINGENLELTSVVEGDVDLFYTINNRKYRYFLRTKDDTFFELKNEKGNDGDYTRDYIAILKKEASKSTLSVDKVKLTTGSLKRYIDSHNKNVNVDYNVTNNNLKVNFRLGLLAGITNHPLVEGLTDNDSHLQIASELEIYGNTDNPLHSGLLQLRQTIGSSGDYKSTELSLGYRIRPIRTEKFNLFVQTRFASLVFSSIDVTTVIGGDVITTEPRNETEFEVPFIFGIGADFKVSNNGYITFLYDRFYALGLDSRDDFPMDFMIGYKLKL